MPYKDKGIRREYERAYYLAHKERMNEATRRSYRKHNVERREGANKRRQETRIEVLTHYGGGRLACVCCGFTDFRALSLDHIDGGGKEEARKRRHTNLANWLKKHGYPDGIQTLCMNCQFIKKIEKKEQLGK